MTRVTTSHVGCRRAHTISRGHLKEGWFGQGRWRLSGPRKMGRFRSCLRLWLSAEQPWCARAVCGPCASAFSARQPRFRGV